MLALAWLLPGLWGRSAWKPDEGYSFGLVLSMLTEGAWIVPTLAGEPFMEKPPLMYGLGALGAWLASPWLTMPEGMRLACIVCAMLAFGFTYLAAREVTVPDRAMTAVWMLAGAPSWLIATRYLTCDVALVSAQAIALYGLARLITRRDLIGWASLGTGVGIGFLSKGLVLVAANGFACLLMLLFHREFRAAISVRAVVIALIAALPWLVVWPALLAYANPVEFRVWIWDNNFGRFFGLNSLGPQNGWHRVIDVAVFLLPVLPVALIAGWQRGSALLRGGYGAAVWLVVAWSVTLATSSQLAATYFLPVFAPLALLAGAVRGPQGRALHVATIALIALIVAMLAAVIAFKLGLINNQRPGFAQVVDAPIMPVALLLVVCAVVAQLCSLSRGSAPSLARLWVFGVVAVWGIFIGLALPWAERTVGFADPINAVLAPLRNDRSGCVASLGLGENERAFVHYYAGVKTQRFERDYQRADACPYLLEQRERGADETIRIAERGKLLARTNRPRDPERGFSLYERPAVRAPFSGSSK